MNVQSVPVFGRIELDSWIEWGPDGHGVGMGRVRRYDDQGRLVEVKTEPTGLTVDFE